MRAPILLYRARLGIIFGHRLLMLEHIGRLSHTRRYAVLEIVDHPSPDRYVVVSGFGARAQWFRNLRAHPSARIWVGSSAPVSVDASLLTPAEVSSALRAYAKSHPRAWRTLKATLEETLGADISTDATTLPMVELTATHR